MKKRNPIDLHVKISHYTTTKLTLCWVHRIPPQFRVTLVTATDIHWPLATKWCSWEPQAWRLGCCFHVQVQGPSVAAFEALLYALETLKLKAFLPFTAAPSRTSLYLPCQVKFHPIPVFRLSAVNAWWPVAFLSNLAPLAVFLISEREEDRICTLC